MIGVEDDLALVEVGDGALLLNLASGVLFQLNGSAAFVWAATLAGKDAPAIAGAFGRRYGVPAERAAADVAAARAMDLRQPAGYPPLAAEFNYERSTDGYLFSFRGAPALVVDHAGDTITRPPGGAPLPGRLEFLLQAIVPKVVALRGGVVMHASAVLGPDRAATGISGPSGAGKTTTARAAAEAGGVLVSEDKLVMAVRDGQTSVFLDGERRLNDWVARAAAELTASGRASCAGVDAASEGDSAPLRALLFIDAGQRTGTEIALSPFDATSAAARVFHNTFYGSDRAADWRGVLHNCARVGASVAAFAATMPAGVPALRARAGALLDSIRSR
jgi:hypothetical protein